MVNAWFKRSYGRAAQTAYDSYITLQANEQSVSGQHEGSDFCPRCKPVFAEAMAVPVASLPQYAAAKNLLPIDLACTSETEIGQHGAARGATDHAPARPRRRSSRAVRGCGPRGQLRHAARVRRLRAHRSDRLLRPRWRATRPLSSSPASRGRREQVGDAASDTRATTANAAL